MEGCVAVEREVDKVVNKFQSYLQNEERSLEEALSLVRAAKTELQTNASDGDLNSAQSLMLSQTLDSVRNVTARLASDHRDLHSSVSKVGKAIDRSFVADFDSTSREDIFHAGNKSQYLHDVVLQHFYRQGQLDIAQTLSREANIPESPAAKEPFQELNSILEALHKRDLGPALHWAERNREALNSKGATTLITHAGGRPTVAQKSSLELRLHKLHYVELLKDGNRLEAIQYAKNYFPQFIEGHEKEVQSLMGAVIYAGPKLATSPYSYLLDSTLWLEICDLFVKDACALMGLSIESPLSVVINAGCKALPALLNIKQVMLQRQVSEVWNAKDELPIEIDVGQECRYHSIFACPILRQQTSDMNPPVRLTCGHCISRDALNKLSAGHKLKCPYCPVEQNPNDARQIFF